MFNQGQKYTKDDIYSIMAVPTIRRKGAWDTGYRKYESNIFIFCNIGVKGRTGHDYNNRWNGKTLVWYGKTLSHIGQPMIKEMITGNCRIHIFTREDNNAPFTYQGRGTAISHQDVSPVEITWSIS